MSKKFLSVAVVAIAILAILLGVYCAQLRLRLAEDVTDRQAAFDAASKASKGMSVSEVCGLEFYFDDSWEDHPEGPLAPVISVGGSWDRNGAAPETYFGHWGLTTTTDEYLIDATDFEPDTADTYLRQMESSGLPRGDRERFNSSTRATKVALTIAREAAAQDDEWVILRYRGVGESAVVIMGHRYGIVTLILIREPGDRERYRLLETVGVFMGVDPSPRRLHKPRK